MTAPGRITLSQAAGSLRIPESTYRLFAHQGYVPAPDRQDTVDSTELHRLRLRNKWLNFLTEKMDRVQANHLCGRIMVMPDTHLTRVAGRDVTELWRILEATLLER